VFIGYKIPLLSLFILNRIRYGLIRGVGYSVQQRDLFLKGFGDEYFGKGLTVSSHVLGSTLYGFVLGVLGLIPPSNSLAAKMRRETLCSQGEKEGRLPG